MTDTAAMNDKISVPRRTLDLFDMMRSSRVLAPHNPKLNDIRWLTGQSLRRSYERAELNAKNEKGIPASERVLYARAKIDSCERVCGRHAWPIVVAVVIDGKPIRDCRKHVLEVVTPWRCDAIITDRLRVALDAIGPILGVTDAERATPALKTAAE